MVTVRRYERQFHILVRQACRRAAVGIALSGAWLLTPTPAQAQQLPYVVTIVDWKPDALERQRRAYRSEAADHEILFCVEAWRSDTATAGFQRIVIERSRRAVSGKAHGIGNLRGLCVGEKGESLPTIHTHSDGNCQFSPRDLVSIAGRAAQFDGVQCGEHHFAWAFSWQIKAVANWIYSREVVGQGLP
jgi:hypothetical protein